MRRRPSRFSECKILRVGLYPGSFDPVTYGHVDIVRRAAHLVDKLVIAIGTHHDKHPLFSAEERVKLLKLLWDCLATEFGGRHELYEINYGGSTEEIRRYCLFGAQASGNADRFKGFAEECMAEYDLDGWKVPDLTDPGELSYHVMRGAGR